MQENLNFIAKEEVVNFMALVDANRPYYVAAGYFVLNRGNLFALFSTITTYFIIVVQFNQSGNK